MQETNIEQLKKEILELKEKQDAVILAHYYVDGEVQAIADYVGDSYFLSKLAIELKEQTIIFCGVSFMGESAKVLNPGKKVVMADEFADCPMAHMAEVAKIEEVRKEWDDVAVVCYVNSTSELKAHSDVCVTSSNAIKVVRNLKEKNIYFIPDENLGRYVAELLKAKVAHPEAEVLTHPECTGDVLELSDFIGSTSQIIDYATESTAKEFIICTEMGVFYELAQKNPDKKFYSVGHRQFCPNMKKITLEKVKNALETLQPEMIVDPEIAEKSCKPLEKMLELAAK